MNCECGIDGDCINVNESVSWTVPPFFIEAATEQVKIIDERLKALYLEDPSDRYYDVGQLYCPYLSCLLTAVQHKTGSNAKRPRNLALQLAVLPLIS